MRIAFVSTILTYPWGSPDRIWTDLANRCLRRGDQVMLAISSVTADCSEVRQLEQSGAQLQIREGHTYFLGQRHELKKRLPWIRKKTIEGHLERFDPHLVVLTLGATFDILAESGLQKWMRVRKVPYVSLCHNSVSDNPLVEADRANAQTYFNACSLTGFVSTQNRVRGEKQLGALFHNPVLFQNPLGFNIEQIPAWPSHDSPIQLGVVGRLDINHKGIDLLLNALSKLATAFDFRLIMTGRIEDEKQLTQLIADANLKDKVEIHPPVLSSRLPSVYAAIELFVLSSRYEGCPSAMIEAMMCGRPVLACPVGGVSDWIEDGRNGFVVSDISAQAIVEGLTRAFENRDCLRAMGEQARLVFDERRQSDPVGELLSQIDATVTSISNA